MYVWKYHSALKPMSTQLQNKNSIVYSAAASYSSVRIQKWGGGGVNRSLDKIVTSEIYDLHLWRVTQD
jgi:hypothetical protein